ncbi:hypothetical protein [Actinomadura litoris]|uniref:hypothetical protein n=1 Tax=Actinomadura litoris TaxID=2678616 RepID=UPI001FA71C0C|nr:hypothetical protein [Actinomadura litoris]
MTTVILCDNPDHPYRTRAIANLSWPNGPYKPCTGCAGCTDVIIRQALDEGIAVTVEPITSAFANCPECRLRPKLRLDGRIEKHKAYGLRCDGSGAEPVEPEDGPS